MENQNKKNIPAQPEFSGELSPEYNTGEKDSKQKNRVKEILEYADFLNDSCGQNGTDLHAFLQRITARQAVHETGGIEIACTCGVQHIIDRTRKL